jgi:hypothetical protein
VRSKRPCTHHRGSQLGRGRPFQPYCTQQKQGNRAREAHGDDSRPPLRPPLPHPKYPKGHHATAQQVQHSTPLVHYHAHNHACSEGSPGPPFSDQEGASTTHIHEQPTHPHIGHRAPANQERGQRLVEVRAGPLQRPKRGTGDTGATRDTRTETRRMPATQAPPLRAGELQLYVPTSVGHARLPCTSPPTPTPQPHEAHPTAPHPHPHPHLPSPERTHPPTHTACSPASQRVPAATRVRTTGSCTICSHSAHAKANKPKRTGLTQERCSGARRCTAKGGTTRRGRVPYMLPLLLPCTQAHTWFGGSERPS